MLNVSRLVGIKEIIRGKAFSKSKFNNTFDDFRYERKISNRTIVLHKINIFYRDPTSAALQRTPSFNCPRNKSQKHAH